MSNNRLFLIFLLIGTAFLSGCMGKRELNELAIVMAVGLDKGKEEGEIKVTVQVVRPADARGQTGAPAANTGDPIWTASAEGESIFEAIRNLSTFSSRRVFWAHNRVIVINEDLAKEGIKDIIDFFSRNPELRMRTWVVVSPDEANKIVSTMTGLEVIPGEAIDKLFRYSPISAQAPRTEMLDLQAAYLSESSEPVLARVRLIDRGVSNKKAGQAGSVQQVELAGAGVFKGDKMLGTLGQKETRGLLPFIEKVESGVIALSCPKEERKKISVELHSKRFKVIPKYKNGKPEFQIKYVSYASMVEAGCPFTLENKEQVEELEKEVERILFEEIKNIISKTQKEYNADILELGKVFKNKYPAEWKKLSKNWDDELRQARIDIQVTVNINDAVLLYTPTKPS